MYVTLSHLRSKESTGIHKPCIPALLSYQGYIYREFKRIILPGYI